MTKLVRPSIKRCKASCIFISVIVSMLLVASSNTSMEGLERTARNGQ